MKINENKNKQISQANKTTQTLGHENHMGGTSYAINDPINQLRIVASSCFIGEPKYYNEEKNANQVMRDFYEKKHAPKLNQKPDYLDKTLGKVLSIEDYRGFAPAKLIETVIDVALAYNPEKTLQEAVRLRNEENIRTTPQVIMVRAANHENVRGTGLIQKYANQIIKRTDEVSVQLGYQLQVFGKPIPNSLKNSWKKYLENCSEYDLAKYKMDSRHFKTVDVVNLVRANSNEINLLMKGQLKLSEEDTWEALISKEGSSKETWTKAIPLMGHMALLRNLRNFVKHDVSPDNFLPKLINTAKNGKQLPFRYFSAYQSLQGETGVSGKILDAIEECLEISLGNMPHFDGKVMSLCDNSGSAQSTTTSELGTVKVSNIANLTAAITGKLADDGYIGVFGDKLKVLPVRKNASVFDLTKEADGIAKNIGMSTENGIWLFFDQAISKKEKWDHIFIYSDMQAGHGGLYGTNPSDYSNYIWEKGRDNRYIDVAKLVSDYRNKVNKDVKVYMVQVAGYQDTLMPEFFENTYILGGWGTGVIKFAHEISKTMDNAKTIKNEDNENLQKEVLNKTQPLQRKKKPV